MDLISILATVILATTIATVLTGVAAYAAFKLRDKRKPKKRDDTAKFSAVEGQEAIFLSRYVPVRHVEADLETPPAAG
jgi:heme/copper-type cytochrome/quinol oxidase subunit 2